MFAFSEQLNYIDISSFVTDHYYVISDTFSNIASNGTIILNKKFTCLEKLPNGWKIIYKE